MALDDLIKVFQSAGKLLYLGAAIVALLRQTAQLWRAQKNN